MEFSSTNPEFGDQQLLLAAQLQADADTADNIYDYYNYLLELYMDHPFIGNNMQEVASLIEPRDRKLGSDDDVPAAKAFYMGIIIGTRLVELRGGEKLIDALQKAPTPILVEKSGDALHDFHLQVSLLMEKYGEAYQTATAYHPLIERWADHLVPDITKQLYFKSGFGMLLSLMQDAERIERYASLEEELENCDWDAEFMKLYGAE